MTLYCTASYILPTNNITAFFYPSFWATLIYISVKSCLNKAVQKYLPGVSISQIFMRVFQEEQIMYPSSLEGERFLVALVNCKRGHYESSDGITQETQAISWEITRALKWE